MRVISGSARGRRLYCLDGDSVRPTLDRVKESVFNMLTPYVPGAQGLDLFCGSGALGIEALSRGAAHMTFVDKNEASLSITRRNLELTQLTENAKCILRDALIFAEEADGPFDLILLDPPYGRGLAENALSAISKNHLLADGGVIVLELDSTEPYDFCSQSFSVFRDKTYGRVRIILMKEL